ncbi:hypothetical protein SAMN04488102_11325 [Alkalibacterium subtropicum]|uniref:Uncharacterized protein n=1 Tax=Alkalibacterium subtropicum TaxID=753702 RepID=A0A1I1KK22_9LACT|nr:hypothetical protein [Alkalibacterium subtropicum]SFC61137.1 hypothetical protein SAMN04488102_11325 [Alkalibacterium subtropicum]
MYAYWMRAEQFYTFTMPLIVMVLLFLAIVFVFAYSYTDPKKPARKYVTRGYLGLIGLCALYFIWGHLTYDHWVEQNEYITPGIRPYQTIVGIRTSEDPSIVRAYRRSDTLKENLLALDMYEAERVTRPFDYTYAGSMGNTHYFTYGDEDQYVFALQGEINWTESERELIGYEFSLTDERFEDIGFYNAPDIIFDSLSLPKSERKELADIDTNDALSINDMIGDWNFGRQFY